MEYIVCVPDVAIDLMVTVLDFIIQSLQLMNLECLKRSFLKNVIVLYR